MRPDISGKDSANSEKLKTYSRDGCEKAQKNVKWEVYQYRPINVNWRYKTAAWLSTVYLKTGPCFTGPIGVLGCVHSITGYWHLKAEYTRLVPRVKTAMAAFCQSDKH